MISPQAGTGPGDWLTGSHSTSNGPSAVSASIPGSGVVAPLDAACIMPTSETGAMLRTTVQVFTALATARARTAMDGLDPAAALLLRLVSELHPGSDVDARAAAAVCGVPVDHAEPLLEALAAAHLVDVFQAGRFRFPDLLRQLAGQECRSLVPAGTREDAWLRMCHWFHHSARNAHAAAAPWADLHTPGAPTEVTPRTADVAPGTVMAAVADAWATYAPHPDRPVTEPVCFASAADGLGWLALERGNLEEFTRRAGVRGQFRVIVDVVRALEVLWLHDPRGDWTSIHRRGLDAARASGQAYDQAHMHERLGNVLGRAGDLDEASEHLTIARDRWLAAKRGNRAAGAGRALAYVAIRQRRLRDALDLLENAVRAHALHEDRRQAALGLAQIGAVYLLDGHPYAAIEELTRAAETLASITGPGRDPYAGANVALYLANAYARTEDFDSAKGQLDFAFPQMVALGSRDGQRRAHETAAIVADGAGDPDAWLAHQTAAEQISSAGPGVLPAAGGPRW